MKKLALLLSLLLILLAGVYLGTAYYFGLRAEKVMAERAEILSGSLKMTVVKRDYQRNWLSSNETLTLRLSAPFLEKGKNQLPAQLRSIFDEQLTLTSKIQHGPWLGTLFGLAKVDTKLALSAEQQKIVKQFFGDNEPLQIVDLINFSGSGSLKATIPAFEYQELSGIKISWGGLNATNNYTAHYASYDSELNAPKLNVKLADLGFAEFHNINYKSRTERSEPINTGNSTLSLQHFSLHWDKSTDYKIRLNDIVNLLADLQIGSFINPTVEVPPTEIELTNFKFYTSSNLKGEFVDSQGKFSFDKLNYGQDVYGPLNIDIEAKHLDAKSLAIVKQKLASMMKAKDDSSEFREQILAIARNEAAPLFLNNPKVDLNVFSLKLPSGMLNMKGKFELNNLKQEDLNDIDGILAKTNADVHFKVPVAAVEYFAQNQVRNIFKTVQSDDESVEEIRNTVNLMVNNFINNMVKQGYLELNQDILSGNIKIQNGAFTLNNQSMTSAHNDEDDDFFDDMNEDANIANENTSEMKI